jgi:hypothetical protein
MRHFKIGTLFALLLVLTLLAPSNVSGQGITPISTLENSLTAAEWPVRARAVSALTRRAPEITASGLTRLIDVLREELDGTSSVVGGDDEGGEAYSEYIMMLTNLVTRFNDPRATPLLARQGIAITNGSVFQVAASGDAGIGPLIGTWNENENLRPAVIRTIGQMRHFADSTGSPLSTQTRATIGDLLLAASSADVPWVRRAFVDAAAVVGDPVYLPLVSDLSANDQANIDGMRYVAREAGNLVPRLEQRRTSSTPASLLQALQGAQAATCRIGWVSGSGICNSLESKLDAAANALTRGNANAASNQLDAFLAEVSAQRGKAVNENAYLLLSDNAQYLIGRM